ncbi:MAG: tryptophan-rich sensory protein [Mycobacterium sp.]|nr:tryptophan-rich sensory protein [Mycobacterium sp.]
MRKALLGTGLATAAAAVAGSVSSRKGVQGWYTTIRKPAYVPPNAVFPIAWTALYVDIAATSAAVIERLRADGRNSEARGYVAALGANLALNAGWSWVFFGQRRLAPAAVAAAALAVSSADLTRRAAPAAAKLRAALAPYPLWCTFATVMSADIWRLNH